MRVIQGVARGHLALAIAAAALSGCAGSRPVQVGMIDPQPVAADGQGMFPDRENPNYVLRPADVISVTVFREPELSLEQIPINPDGNISLPGSGTFKADGKSARELAKEIEQYLEGKILVNPSVAVNVIQFGSHTVAVEGAVKNSGVYPFKPGARLTSAIALAGGTDRVAKLRDVAIFRQLPDGMAVAKFDYAQVRAGTMIDPVLAPGDRVFVGTSGLSQLWQDFLKAVPAFALFTRF